MIWYLNLYEDGYVGEAWLSRKHAETSRISLVRCVALLVVRAKMTRLKGNGLTELLRKAAQHKMTPDEIETQRQSWVRGEMALKEMGLD